MPSRYSSDHSLSDAEALAKNLGIDMRTISIEPAFAAYMDMLDPSFDGRQPGSPGRTFNPRCRGQILMALSNEFGWMVLTTGNKSEAAVGYFTIYGDSVGGYAVIKDLLKLKVYDLCRLVNERAGNEVIPHNIIVKPPSAELRPDQRDDQSLPAYEVLDPILSLYVEHDRTAQDIIDEGHDPEMVSYPRLVDIAEYKRRQSPRRSRHRESLRERPAGSDHEWLSLIGKASSTVGSLHQPHRPAPTDDRDGVRQSHCTQRRAQRTPLTAAVNPTPSSDEFTVSVIHPNLTGSVRPKRCASS